MSTAENQHFVRRLPWQFLVRGMLVAVATVGFVFGAVPLIWTQTDLHQFRAQCQNNLRQVAIALRSYAEKHGSFPPAYVVGARGTPLYSWRALVLGGLERGDLASRLHLDEFWDGPHNKHLSEQSVATYCCPSDRQSLETTDYLVVVGPNTAWPGATGRKLSEIKNPEKTILVIELVDTGINWLEPRDIQIGEFVAGVNRPGCFGGHGICSHHGEGGANVLFADGHVEFLPNDTDAQTILSMLDVRNP